MKSENDGAIAAVMFAYFLATVAVVFGAVTLTTPRSDLMPYEQQGYKSERDRCKAKLRMFGEQEATDGSASKNQHSQQKLDEICLHIRSTEAAEWAAEYARRQYAWTIISVGLVFVATCAAAAAAAFTWRQANIARQAFMAADRPWIFIKDLRPQSDVLVNENGIRVNVTYSVQNIGVQPATNVFSFCMAFAEQQSAKEHIARIEAKYATSEDIGFSLFPKEAPIPFERLAWLGRDIPGIFKIGDEVRPVIVAFVAYVSPVHGTYHMTTHSIEIGPVVCQQQPHFLSRVAVAKMHAGNHAT